MEYDDGVFLRFHVRNIFQNLGHIPRCAKLVAKYVIDIYFPFGCQQRHGMKFEKL
jgi:hypothetical protein